MPDEKKTALWKLYARARQWERDGMPHMEISAKINTYTSGEIPGYQSLQNSLGVGEAPKTRGEKLKGSLAQVGEGLTFGHLGEAAGGLAALGGGDYAGTRERVENLRESHRQAYPGSSMAGEAAGSMIPLLATGGGATGTQAVGGVAQRALTGGAAATLTGGVGGAAYGHGAAEPGQRNEGALMGGALGAGAGGAFGVAMPFLGGIGRRLGIGAMEQAGNVGQRAGQAIRRRFPARNLADAELRGALQAADLGAEQVAPAMRAMPEGSVIADLDPALARVARGARNQSPALERSGGPVRRVQARHLHRGERMANAARTHTQIAEVADPDEILKASRAAWRDQHLRPLQQNSPEFGSMRMGNVMKENAELAEYLRLNGQDMQKFKDTGRLDFGAAWDALQDMKARVGSPNMRSTRKEALIDTINVFEEMMEDAIPEFKASQMAYRNLSARYDAYALGKKHLTKPGAELRAAWGKLSDDGERVAFREGLMDAIDMKLREEATGGSLAAAQIRDRAAERVQKLRILFPDDASFDGWIKTLANEDRWAITNGFLQGNSSTVMQGLDAGLGGYITTGRAALNEILSVVFEDPQIRAAASEQVGQILLAEGEDAAVALAMRLANQAKQQGGRAAIPIAIGARTGAGTARMMPPAEDN